MASCWVAQVGYEPHYMNTNTAANRRAAIVKFREKRKARNFDKKVRCCALPTCQQGPGGGVLPYAWRHCSCCQRGYLAQEQGHGCVVDARPWWWGVLCTMSWLWLAHDVDCWSHTYSSSSRRAMQGSASVRVPISRCLVCTCRCTGHFPRGRVRNRYMRTR